MSEKETQKKGGKRRCSIPPVCKDKLKAVFQKRFEAVKEQAFDFGVYNHVTTAMQPHPGGLAENEHLIKGLVAISNGEIKPTQLKDALENFGRCNDTQFKNSFWAMSKAQKVITLLAHWRRVKYEESRRQQCLAKATQSETRAIHRLVALEPGMSRTENTLPIVEKEPKQASPKRKLQETHSDATLDSEGWPKMLQTPPLQSSGSGLKQSPSTRKVQKEANSPLQQDICPKGRRLDFNNLQQKLLEEAKAASDALPKKVLDEKAQKKEAAKVMKRPAKAPTKTKKDVSVKKKPSTSKDKSEANMWKSKGLEQSRVLKKTQAKDQSYIQMKQDNKWVLLIGCSKGMAENYGKHHHKVVDLLWDAAQTMSKEQLKERRANILAKPQDVD